MLPWPAHVVEHLVVSVFRECRRRPLLGGRSADAGATAGARNREQELIKISCPGALGHLGTDNPGGRGIRPKAAASTKS